MLRSVKTHQRQARFLDARVDGTGTAAMVTGSQHLSLTDNGTGDYTLTLTEPGTRLLGAWFTPIDADVVPQIDISDSGATAVNVVFKDLDGTPSAADCDFFALVAVSDAADET